LHRRGLGFGLRLLFRFRIRLYFRLGVGFLGLFRLGVRFSDVSCRRAVS